jgi:hypothetical protein
MYLNPKRPHSKFIGKNILNGEQVESFPFQIRNKTLSQLLFNTVLEILTRKICQDIEIRASKWETKKLSCLCVQTIRSYTGNIKDFPKKLIELRN